MRYEKIWAIRASNNQSDIRLVFDLTTARKRTILIKTLLKNALKDQSFIFWKFYTTFTFVINYVTYHRLNDSIITCPINTRVITVNWLMLLKYRKHDAYMPWHWPSLADWRKKRNLYRSLICPSICVSLFRNKLKFVQYQILRSTFPCNCEKIENFYANAIKSYSRLWCKLSTFARESKLETVKII